MVQIAPPINPAQKILGQQRINEENTYRLTAHCVRIEQPEGVLLYHTLTGEVLLLTKGEADKLRELPGPVPADLGELAPRWFLRPEGADDMALADQVRQIAERFRKKETALTKYIIFTTMACNARCFYCFETGWENSTMSDETARATAAYIMKHCGGKPVRLGWFGGEPLVNAKVIDIITDQLRRQGGAFHSGMTTNGYLFDEAMVRRAKDDWNLQEAHITLDGTEEIYNARKNYVNPEGSPFQRVLRNIGLLLDAGVQVNVRLNMDRDNEGDLYTLIDQLAERFLGKPGFCVYLEGLRENTGSAPQSYTEEERRAYAEKLRSLRVYTESKGVAEKQPLRRGLVVNACKADSEKYTVVTTEGRLSRCESCRDGAVWGSVFSEERDEEVLRQWKEFRPPVEACKDCAIYPQCFRLKKCPNWPGPCSPIERGNRENRFRRMVLGAYEDWKAAGHT